MAKTRTVYVCQSCGHEEPKWLGWCTACNSRGSLVEETQRATRAVVPAGAGPVPLREIEAAAGKRLTTGIGELDRVLGGGMVPGSLVLIGGDPGIGKSTLLLQVADRAGIVLYVTAEESAVQVKLRAERLGLRAERVHVLAETSLEVALAAVDTLRPTVVIVDSVQTVSVADNDGAPGTVSQVRAVTLRLLELAKGRGVVTFVVGHVTKEGTLAGPKMMEHMVDTVLYFEGDRTQTFRLLRAHKNRFGSVSEIGVFEMNERGLEEVTNPSELFLSQRAEDSAGSVVIAALEGSRPLLVELQALLVRTAFGTPRRTAMGVDPNRVALLLAVLERRAGVDALGYDVFLNVAGGVEVREPGVDLGVCVALVSSLRDRAVARKTLVIGEVGLGGEVRAVSQAELRVGEAKKLGFERVVLPRRNLERWTGARAGVELTGVADVGAALEACFE